MSRDTGLLDKNGNHIMEGDYVSLAGNMTSDDSLGFLPNGWFFDETDVYEVYWDERINNWSLKIDVQPDSPYNIKYLNHAVSLLHSGGVEIVKNILEDVGMEEAGDSPEWHDPSGVSHTGTHGVKIWQDGELVVDDDWPDTIGE